MPNKTISLSLPHNLGEAEAKRRIVSGITDARTKFPGVLAGAKETWNGNSMDFTMSAMGQTITGRAQVEAEHVRLDVDLPMIFAMLADKLKPKIEAEGKRLLAGPGDAKES